MFKFSQLRSTDYLLVFKSLTAFGTSSLPPSFLAVSDEDEYAAASLCLFALLVTVTVAIICLKNFDHGLKQQSASTTYYLNPYSTDVLTSLGAVTGSSRKEPLHENGQYMLETTNGDRMSLD